MEGRQDGDVEEMQTEAKFATKSQLDAFRPYMVRGETLIAGYHLKGEIIGAMGISDKRLVLLDRAFAGKKKAVVSIPYSRVSSVAADASGEAPFRTATLHVTTVGGRTFELQFRSSEKARHAYSTLMQQILQGEIAG